MTRLLRLMLAMLFVALVPVTVAAQVIPADIEAIERFDSKILVETDGAASITETIDVNAQGKKIKRGIFREIPLIRDGIGGARVTSQLSVLSVTRDGRVEPFHVVERDGIANVWVGSTTVDVPHGRHRYTLKYRMTRAVDFLDTQDQLFWNVTGNAWSLMILKTSALVMLPDGACIQAVGISEGPSGTAERRPAVGKTRTQAARFGTNQLLLPGSGMTIRIDFDKGAVIVPSETQARTFWLADYHHLLMPLVGLVLLVLALLAVWLATGNRRRLPCQTKLQDGPPEGLSPVQCHVIQNMGFTWNGWAALTAGLVELARKKCITLDLAATPQRIDVVADQSPEEMPPEEQAILAQLRERGPSLLINRSDGFAFSKAKSEMQRAANNVLGKRYFRQSNWAICLCIALYIAMLGFFVYTGLDVGASLFVGIFFLGGPPALICIALQDIRRHLRRRILTLWAVVMLVGLALLVAGLFGHPLFNATTLAIALGLYATVAAAIGQIVYTAEGREAAAKIRVFRAWLIAGEQVDDRQYAANLAYAIALDAETQWAARLASNLAVAGAPEVSQLSMRANRVLSGPPVVGGALASALMAASPRSSSSGRSSGGGGSGGGGGGGGGGGW